MPSPRVTVIVPNYNHARFLARRLDSIFAQTYQDWELLYLDDASTDNSADVFAPYAANPRVRAILNTQNTGSPFPQWNRGVREARGEYVWIAEADDDADPRLLETLVAKLDAHPAVGLAYCQSLMVDENGTVLQSAEDRTRGLHPTHWTEAFVSSGRDECRRYLIRNCFICNASAALFRKGIYQQVGGADETMRAAGDWLLYAHILLASDIAFVPDTLNFFRQHSRSVTHKAKNLGVGLEEAYRVTTYIATHVDVDKQTLRLACDSRMAEWRAVVLSSDSRIPWRRSLALCKLARVIDGRLPLRLGKLLLTLAARAVLRLARPAAPVQKAAEAGL